MHGCLNGLGTASPAAHRPEEEEFFMSLEGKLHDTAAKCFCDPLAATEEQLAETHSSSSTPHNSNVSRARADSNACRRVNGSLSKDSLTST